MNEPHQNADAGMPTPEQLVGHQVRLLRQGRGWSQQEVAQKMRAYGYQWSQATVTRLESASRPIRVNELADLAILFDVPVAQFLDSGVSRGIALERLVADLTERRDAIQVELERESVLARAAAQSEAVLAAEVARLNANLAVLHERNPGFRETARDVAGESDRRE
jgi:transcriptional regulator with XRE-family HTH domain